MKLKNMIRNGRNRMGFDVVRVHRLPKSTLLVLAGLEIGTLIDVDANQRELARLIRGFFTRAQLCCFEPLPDPLHQLASWAQTQKGRVHCPQLALGHQEGEAEMDLHEQDTLSSSVIASTATTRRFFPQKQAARANNR